MKRTVTTYAAMLQVTAILLLQWYALAPCLGRQEVRLQCRGEHRLCGCAAARVADHTCCCLLSKPACCRESHREEDRLAKEEERPSSYLSIAPCGSAPEFNTVSLDQLKFVPAEIWQIVLAQFLREFPASLGDTASSRVIEPPDPPPKLIAIT